jgi:hypothetical protein
MWYKLIIGPLRRDEVMKVIERIITNLDFIVMS